MALSVTDLIAELLPIAESLFSLIDKIKTQAPDAWASVSAEYVQAAQAWNDAKLAAAQTDTVTPVAETSAPTAPLAASIGDASSAPAHTLSTVDQVAAGLPPANYTPS